MKEVVKDLAVGFVEALLIVAIVVSVAYAATGTWHVAFAVESGSMEPNMHRGDLIFVTSPSRTNIITYEQGKEIGYKSFNDYGDVIIYYPNGNPSAEPIIHRAMEWTETPSKGGYITKGDANLNPDQPVLSEPVKPEWIIAVAKIRMPYIGYARLIFPF